jgi:hypothetical protein
MEGGPTTKHKHASNLFDLIKQVGGKHRHASNLFDLAGNLHAGLRE